MTNFKSNPRQILLSFPHPLLGKILSAPGKLAKLRSAQKSLQSQCQNNLRKIDVNFIPNFSGSRDAANFIKSSTVSYGRDIRRFGKNIFPNGDFNSKRAGLSSLNSFIPANISCLVSSIVNKEPAQKIPVTLLSESSIYRPVITNLNPLAFYSTCNCNCPKHPSDGTAPDKGMSWDVRKPVKSHRYGKEGFLARYGDILPTFVFAFLGGIAPILMLIYIIKYRMDVSYYPWKKRFPYEDMDPMHPTFQKAITINQPYRPNPQLKKALDALDPSKPGGDVGKKKK